MTIMTRTKRSMIALLAVLLSAGCTEQLTVPNFNSPAKEDLTGSPSLAVLGAAIRGNLITARGLKNGFVTRGATWGREGYDLRPEEPRTITDALIDPIDPVNGGRNFGGQYTQMAAINTVLTAVENADLSDAQKNAIRGFVKTMKADALWQVIMSRPVGVGIPLEPNDDPLGELSPIVAPAGAYDFIFALYDEANTNLQAGGGSFPFDLPSGLSDFNTPGSFSQVNRGLKARALKYQGRWAEAKTALAGSFMSSTRSMDFGAFFNYSTISGDATNGLFSVISHFAHPRILADAQLQGDGSKDQRALDKTEPVPAQSLLGITATEDMTVYTSLDAPFPWVTNDELLLISAEAELGLGNTAAAITAVNVVRVGDGGLDPLPGTFPQADLLDEILYNRLMSLMWEGMFTYFDARQYNKLDELPRALPTHGVYLGNPYPQNECLARPEIASGPECATYFAIL